jgi:four helix bundle protein
MGAKDFTELVVWQLADELRRGIVAFTAIPPASRDGRFCLNLRDASESVCRNIAEGFGRRCPPQFSQFLTIALGSLPEIRDQLIAARHRGYLDVHAFRRLSALARRTNETGTVLQRYLDGLDRRR